MNLRDTGYRFDKTNDYIGMKRNNDGSRQVFIFDNIIKNCNAKINYNIFSKANYFL